MAPAFTYSAYSKNEKLNIGIIGVGLRGTNHLQNLLVRKDVNITAICDIDPSRITHTKELISKAGGVPPKVFGINDYDYQNLLGLKEVEL